MNLKIVTKNIHVSDGQTKVNQYTPTFEFSKLGYIKLGNTSAIIISCSRHTVKGQKVTAQKVTDTMKPFLVLSHFDKLFSNQLLDHYWGVLFTKYILLTKLLNIY